MTKRKGVLFVCLGNICRSPIAEAVFGNLIKERQLGDEWFCDSAGTGGWHVGHQPDRRAQKVLKKNNVEFNHRARQLCEEDFQRFDYIFGMDNSNISDIKEMEPKNSKAKIELLGKYDPQGQSIIEDPYYGGENGFEMNFQQCLRSCNAFLDQVDKN